MKNTRYVHGVARDHVKCAKDDFYPTPPEAVLALLEREKFDGDIWEPACGDGAISKILLERGYTVRSTDLVDRGYGTPRIDFLLEFCSTDNIVTNPPFKLWTDFAYHAVAQSRNKVALLGRLACLEGLERMALFQNTPFARCYVFARRVTMVRDGDESLRGGGSMVAFAWFVWDHSHTGLPTLHWLDVKRNGRNI